MGLKKIISVKALELDEIFCQVDTSEPSPFPMSINLRNLDSILRERRLPDSVFESIFTKIKMDRKKFSDAAYFDNPLDTPDRRMTEQSLLYLLGDLGGDSPITKMPAFSPNVKVSYLKDDAN